LSLEGIGPNLAAYQIEDVRIFTLGQGEKVLVGKADIFLVAVQKDDPQRDLVEYHLYFPFILHAAPLPLDARNILSGRTISWLFTIKIIANPPNKINLC
jgi:hypothetical protein